MDMVEQKKDESVEEKDESVEEAVETPEASVEDTAGEKPDEDPKPLTSSDIRNGSYFVLVIAAVFVINAMETGSYRTPWPVAIIVSLVGLGLFAYSFVKEKQEKDSS